MHQDLRDVRTIDAVLADARAQLDRLSPVEAWSRLRTGGALIIDIRTPNLRPLAQPEAVATIWSLGAASVSTMVRVISS